MAWLLSELVFYLMDSVSSSGSLFLPKKNIHNRADRLRLG